jgi:hypothetical protein
MYVPQSVPLLSFTAREVVKELDRKPHLLVAVDIEGTHFPARDAPPFARLVLDGGATEFLCWFAEVSEDGRRLRAYFPVDLPDHGVIEYGYGNRIFGRLPLSLDTSKLSRLDARRLPQAVVRVDKQLLSLKRR